LVALLGATGTALAATTTADTSATRDTRRILRSAFEVAFPTPILRTRAQSGNPPARAATHTTGAFLIAPTASITQLDPSCQPDAVFP
jgi:hypothetical protein